MSETRSPVLSRLPLAALLFYLAIAQAKGAVSVGSPRPNGIMQHLHLPGRSLTHPDIGRTVAHALWQLLERIEGIDPPDARLWLGWVLDRWR